MWLANFIRNPIILTSSRMKSSKPLNWDTMMLSNYSS